MICWVPEDDAESVKIVDGQHNLSQVEPCPRLCELTLLLLCDRRQQEYIQEQIHFTQKNSSFSEKRGVWMGFEPTLHSRQSALATQLPRVAV